MKYPTRGSLTLGICVLVLIAGIGMYAIGARNSDKFYITQANAAMAVGNYDAAEADLGQVHWLKNEAKSVRATIAAQRLLDAQAWSDYDAAAQRFTRAATDPYNSAGPPRAMFDQVVAMAQAIVSRPAMFTMSDSVLTQKLASPAKTMFIRYVTPTYASKAIPYSVRVLQIFSCKSGWGWFATGTALSSDAQCNGIDSPPGATAIAFLPAGKSGAPTVVNMGNSNAAQDESITQEIIALPWHTGFALDFSGSMPTLAWSCVSCEGQIAWHVVRVDPSGSIRVDGDALPSGVIATSSSGFTATGTFAPDADNGSSNPDAPFDSCEACPHLERIADMTWNGDKYIVTSATVDTTAYAALVQYINSETPDQFASNNANFADLSHLKLIQQATTQGATCGVNSDSSEDLSEANRPKIATVQVLCGMVDGDQSIEIIVKAVKTSSGYKLQGAYQSDADSAGSGQDQ